MVAHVLCRLLTSLLPDHPSGNEQDATVKPQQTATASIQAARQRLGSVATPALSIGSDTSTRRLRCPARAVFTQSIQQKCAYPRHFKLERDAQPKMRISVEADVLVIIRIKAHTTITNIGSGSGHDLYLQTCRHFAISLGV